MLAALGAVLLVPGARAESLGPYSFEPPAFVPGDIDGQNGWAVRLAPVDAGVVELDDFPDAAGYGFGSQALRFSDKTGSSFSGVRTPLLDETVGEAAAGADVDTLDYSFSIGTVTAAHQPGLRISVSASDQGPSRLTYLRFEDQEDGVHVFFAGAVNPGPLGTVTDFPETDIATLDRGTSHRVRVLARFVEGGGGTPEGNDVVKVLIDGQAAHVGGTWENYYRYDPEQAVNGNELPVIDQVLFRLAGNTVTHPGGGFLVDQVSVASAPLSAPVNVEPPALGGDATVGGTLTCSTGTWDGEDLQHSFRWLRDGEPIPGTDGPAYVVTGDDVGRAIACEVTATSLFDQSATASSDSVTIAQPATPPPPPPPDPAPQPAPAPPPPPPPTDEEPEVETPRGPAPVQGATAAVAVVSCGADAPCVLDVPRRVRIRIGGKTYFVLVRAPRRVAPGATARIRIKLPRAALKALRQASRRQGAVRLPITVRTGGERTTQRIRAKVRLRSGSVKRG